MYPLTHELHLRSVYPNPPTELKRNHFEISPRDLLQIFSTRGGNARNRCNARIVRTGDTRNVLKACMEIRRVEGCVSFPREKRNETMRVGYKSVGDRDYSRVCMPRVSHNRRKYAVNLTATIVAHHLSLERVRFSTSTGRRVCANRESSLVTFSRTRYTLYFHPGNLVDRHRLPTVNLSFAALNALVLRIDPKLCELFDWGLFHAACPRCGFLPNLFDKLVG